MDKAIIVIGAFSEAQAERLTGVSAAQLRRWDRTALFRPSYPQEEGTRAFTRIYSFKDIVSLRVLNQLRNVYSVSGPELRKAARVLSEYGNDIWISKKLYVHRRKVVFDEPESHKKREITSKQFVADIPLAVAIADTHSAVREMNRRGDDQIGHVLRAKFLNHRALVLAGTRIPVRVIREFADAGYTSDQILAEYPDLTLGDIEAALALTGAAAAA